MFGAIVYIPLYLQTVHGASPTASGLELLPMVAGMLATFIFSGQLVSRTGRYKIFPIVGSAVLAVGLAMLAQLGPHTSYGWPPSTCWSSVSAWGSSCRCSWWRSRTPSRTPQLGAATSTSTFFRTIGGSFGVSALGEIFNSRLLSSLKAHATPGQLSLVKGGNISANPAQINHLPLAERLIFINAFSHGLQGVFLAAVPFAVLAFVLSWLMKEIPLRTTSNTGTIESSEPDRDVDSEVAGEFAAF